MTEKKQEPGQEGKAHEAQITAIEAVRQVLNDLGKNTMPIEIQKQVKERFAIDMTAGYASKLKSKVLNEEKTKAAKTPDAKPAQKEEATRESVSVPIATPPSNGKAILLEDILTLRELVERVGAEEIKTLIGVMSGR